MRKTEQVKQEVTIICCDVCGKEIKTKTKYLSITAYDEEGVYYEKKPILDLCDDCVELEKRLFFNTIAFPGRYSKVTDKEKQELINKLRKIKVEIERNEE